MATLTYPQPPNGRRLFLFAALLLLGTIAGKIALGSHSTGRHGSDAVRIRECLERNGPVQTWQQDDDPSIHIFCVEMEPRPCGKIGILIAQVWPSIVQGCDYRERTSFVPRDGSPEKVRDYLSRFARLID